MRIRSMVAACSIFAISASANSQEVERYVGRDKKVKVVTPDQRLPVVNGAVTDPMSALDSISANSMTSLVAVSSPSVLYSLTVTLTQGQGPGRLMVWDSTTIPPDGPLSGASLPLRCVYSDQGDRTTIFASTIGLGMDNGIAWAFSTGANCQTLTRATANFVAVSYKAAAQ